MNKCLKVSTGLATDELSDLGVAFPMNRSLEMETTSAATSSRLCSVSKTPGIHISLCIFTLCVGTDVMVD